MAQAPQTTVASSANAGTSGSTTATAANKDLPRDARVIGLILASLGVTDAEPGVVAQLLEFAHRYTTDILQTAQIYAEHASRPKDASSNAGSGAPLEVDDLRIAVSSKLEHSYSSPLPKEFLLPLAAQINRIPLPVIPDSYGIRLPHERERLTAVNWDLQPVKERREFPDETLQMQQDQQGTGQASTSALGGDMDIELNAREDLFGGREDEDEDAENDDDDEDGEDDDGDDDDDDDDEDMEEVLDPSLQQQPNGQQDTTATTANDNEEEDAEGEGEDGDNDENASEDARGEDDDYDA